MVFSVNFGDESRKKLKKGVDTVADAVGSTLGANGRNVIIDKGGNSPYATKDGVNTSKAIFLKDPIENMGAQLIKGAASKTVDKVGDGTSTSTVLARAMIEVGYNSLNSGANPMDLKRGIDKAVKEVILNLKEQATPVGGDIKKMTQVAVISANNDREMGELIANAKEAVGVDGVVTVEESKGIETTLEVVEGLEIERGYIAQQFVTNPVKMAVEMDNPYILMYDREISSMNELLPVMEQTVPTGRPLLIIAKDVVGEALATLVVNKVNGTLNVAAIKAEGFGDLMKDILDDIAVVTDGTAISEASGLVLADVTLAHLGGCEKIKVTKDKTEVINGHGAKDDIKERIESLRTQTKAEGVDEFYINKAKKRIAKLSGGVAIIYVGAATEVEMRERIDRVDDALAATTAAIEEGIVDGGGVALLKAKAALLNVSVNNKDEQKGVNIVKEAIESPLQQILANAGFNHSVQHKWDVFGLFKTEPEMYSIIRSIESDGLGYNVKNNTYCNMMNAGIIDPVKVTRIALENASSIAGMFLTTECVISQNVGR